MIIVWILLSLAALYAFLIAPRLPRRPLGDLAGWDYAHRGLWNGTLPENSLSAFRNAVSHGFGMEMDVHITRDDQLVVFHDDDLKRMCGDSRRVSECTLAELQSLTLLDTQERIPTFDAFLTTVNGRTPLIIELKSDSRIDRLCELVSERLKGYSGVYCIESFDPRAVRWWRIHRPEIIRGQLAYGLVKPYRGRKTAQERMMASLIVNCLGRPDFIAFEANTDHSIPVRAVRLFRPHMVAWTVRSQAQMDALKSRYELQIFERFIPGEGGKP